MKKILFCILLFLFVVPKVEAKELYSCTVGYIDHDDYFDYIKERKCVLENEKISNPAIEEAEETTKEKEIVKETEVKTEEEMKEVQEEITPSIEINAVETIAKEDTKEEVTSNNYYAVNGNVLNDNKVKVVDVSYYQGIINWDIFKKESNAYGVIVRLGYKTTLDKYFKRNIEELTRLNIPYGVYLFSYALNSNDAKKEAEFVNKIFNEYKLNPTLGIYYDLESWSTKTSNTNSITKNGYNYIANKFVTTVRENVGDRYSVGVYSGRWYAMNRLGNIAKSYVSWVAEYNKTLKYDGPYKMWQYTSNGSEPGINGRVDISYLYK